MDFIIPLLTQNLVILVYIKALTFSVLQCSSYIKSFFGKIPYLYISIQVKVLAPLCNGLPIPVVFQISLFGTRALVSLKVLKHVIIFRETRLPS